MQTRIITATKAQTALTQVFKWVEDGDKVIFVKYGKEIAKMVKVEEEDKRKAAQELVDWVKKNSIKTKKTIDSTKIIRKMRDDESKSLGY